MPVATETDNRPGNQAATGEAAVHRHVAHALADQGVQIVFGVMGDANMLYLADYIDEFGGTYAAAAHECGAVGMADGHARMTATVGVVSITHGPAVTNALTALVEATRARTPLVVITGETSSDRRGHLQWLDLAAVIAPTGAGYYKVRRADQAVEDIGRALHVASLESRPFVLDIPADLMAMRCDYRSTAYGPVRRQPSAPDPQCLDEPLGLLAFASRPVILAGRGAVLAGAKDALIQLAEASGAMLATTVGARGLFRGHGRYIGTCGTISSSVGTAVLAQADCILAFGAGLNEYTTDGGSLVRGKPVVQVDVDAARISQHMHAQFSVTGDARLTAELMLTQLSAAGWTRGGDQQAEIQSSIASYDPAAEFTDASRPGTVDVRTAMLALNDLLPGQFSLVCDAGRFMLPTWRYLNVPDSALAVQTNNGGSIGLGLGVAIGAAWTDPNRLSVCVVGDGGAMMSLMEFDTAVRYGLPLLVILINDGAYGIEDRSLRQQNRDPGHSHFRRPSFAAIAKAFGGEGFEVASIDDLASLPADVFKPRARPVLVEILTDPAIDTF